MWTSNRSILATLAGVTLMGFAGLAAAQGHPGSHGSPRGMVFDTRYHHDHYYPPRGFAVGALPRGYRTVYYGRDRYFFSGGVWYRPWGPRFTVIAPPIGVVVPFLPDSYTTVWFGGVPYYYANDAYYVWRRDANGYVVTDPPPGSPQSQAQQGTAPAPAGDDFFMYPKNGQSQDEQSKDRFECHQWSVGQTGFDP